MTEEGDSDTVASLREEAPFFRSLLANTSEGLLTIDSSSQIIFANPAIERILGYRPEGLVGQPKMKIIPERLRPVHAAGLQQYLETGEKHIDWDGVELPALHKDGHEVDVSVSLREHTYDGERYFTGIFVDISDRKERERKLRRQKQELKEFADLLSHDLRNPLSVAMGYVELVREEQSSDELVKVANALDRMDAIITDTLRRSGRETTGETTEQLSFGEVVRSAWDSVSTQGGHLSLANETWQIRAHRGRLCQLLENLIRNAVEHAGTDVTVRIGILDDQPGFFVEDDGSGLSDEVKVRLEKPDESTDAVHGGYGLHIVATIAEEHGWEMRIAEGPTGGARFEFLGATVNPE